MEKIITYAWRWDKNLTISMKANEDSHPKESDMKRLIEVMMRPQVKDMKDWVYHSSTSSKKTMEEQCKECPQYEEEGYLCSRTGVECQIDPDWENNLLHRTKIGEQDDES